LKQLSSLLKISVSLLFIFSSLSVSAGDPYRPSAGAGEAGTGYSCITKKGFWTSFHNQANFAFSKSFSLGFNYENRFNIHELGTRSAGLTIPAGKTGIGALYSHFGYADFSRDFAGIACGMKLSDKIAAGVQIDYLSERATGKYENNQTLTCEAGIIVMASENTRLGIHIFNPVPNSVRKSVLPSSLRIGAGMYLNKILFAGVEAEMSTVSNLLLRTGFEYEARKNFWLRGGFCTDNNSFSFGVGYLAKIMQLDLGFVTHDKLGITSSASIIFKMKSINHKAHKV
jgi:hypothetical protein